MNAHRRGVIVALLVASASIAASSTAARPAARATGSFTFLADTITPIGSADGNVFLSEDASVAYAGDLAGAVNDTDTLVIHSDGSLNGHGTEVCQSCTIGGRTGSFAAVFTLNGSPDGSVAGTLTITGAGGGLAGLHGQGAFLATETTNTYSLDYHFDP